MALQRPGIRRRGVNASEVKSLSLPGLNRGAIFQFAGEDSTRQIFRKLSGCFCQVGTPTKKFAIEMARKDCGETFDHRDLPRAASLCSSRKKIFACDRQISKRSDDRDFSKSFKIKLGVEEKIFIGFSRYFTYEVKLEMFGLAFIRFLKFEISNQCCPIKSRIDSIAYGIPCL